VDWLPQPDYKLVHSTNRSTQFNRLGSLFAYLDSNCSGGETYFPELTGVSGSADMTKFTRGNSSKGLYIKPKRANAIFWNNLHANGSGDWRVAHAGLPVRSGRKIGINIWSHYLLDEPMIGAYD
jgi:prolyl 4-hydroxylase